MDPNPRLEIIHRQVRTWQVAEGSTDADNRHTRGPAGSHSGQRILEYHATGSRDSQQFRGPPVNLGIGLGTADLVAVQHHLEVCLHSGLFQKQGDVFRLGVTGQRHGRVPVPLEKSAQAGHQQILDPPANHVPVHLFLGGAARGNLGGGETIPIEIPDDVVVALTQVALLHRRGHLQSEASVENLPSLAMHRMGIDDHAIHVEDQCQAGS